MFTFLSGFLTGLFTHAFTIKRERNARLKLFRAGIQKRLYELNSVAPDRLMEWYGASIEVVRNSCADIREDIATRKQVWFDRIISMYCGMTKTDIENPDAEHFMNMMRGRVVKPDSQLFDFTLGKNRIAYLLEKMIECSRRSAWIPFH